MKKGVSKNNKMSKDAKVPLTVDQEEALVELDLLLTMLSLKYPMRSFDISQITTTEDIEMLKQFNADTGMLFLSGATTPESFATAKRNFVSSFLEMFKYDIPKDQLEKISLDNINSINQFRVPKFGSGNASFAYLNKQYTELEKTPTAIIGGEKIYMAINAVHSRVNLPLLLDNPHTTAVLMALTHIYGMVSWDSAKYASNPYPKPKDMTKQELTKFHFDLYGGNRLGGQRIQAIIVHEGVVKLGYVPYTHRPEVQHLISRILKKTNLYSQNGFISTNESYLTKVLEKYVIAPDTNTLVTWKETVIHAEATFGTVNESGYCKFVSRKDQPNSDRYRFVVGVHQPVGLDQSDIRELGRLAEHGLIPDFYFKHNSKTKVWDNIKNGKSTQFKRPREISTEEQDFMMTAIKDRDDTMAVFESLQPLKKHLYGVYQSLDQLGFVEKDLELLK
jgi:hypothetical protein